MVSTQSYATHVDQIKILRKGSFEHSFLNQAQEVLSARIRNDNWDLHMHHGPEAAFSVADPQSDGALALVYSRPQEQACLIERLMGKDRVKSSEIAMNCHPTIELRLTPEQFVIELALSPHAWWDQLNYIGKLTVPRHRIGMRTMLANIDDDFCFGFWEGNHLSDMHLANWQLLRGNIFEEWMGTFCEGQDWLRIGRWYDREDLVLDSDFIEGELMKQFKALYDIFKFTLWSSDNNFHNFCDHKVDA